MTESKKNDIIQEKEEKKEVIYIMKRAIAIEYEIKDRLEDFKEIGKNYRSDVNYFYSRY